MRSRAYPTCWRGPTACAARLAVPAVLADTTMGDDVIETGDAKTDGRAQNLIGEALRKHFGPLRDGRWRDSKGLGQFSSGPKQEDGVMFIHADDVKPTCRRWSSTTYTPESMLNPMKRHFGERIRELREERGISQAMLGKIVGVSRASVTQWEDGTTKELKGSNLQAIAKYFGANPDWILKEIPPKYIRRPATQDDSPRRIQEEPAAYMPQGAIPMPAHIQAVPVVGSAQLGDNGYWAELDYPVGHGDGYIDFPTRDPNAYALRCKGDSMAPRIKDGEFVVIEPNATPHPGDEVMVKSEDGRVMVKELLYVRDGIVHLASVNESHGRISIPLNQVAAMHLVVGIVKRTRWRPD